MKHPGFKAALCAAILLAISAGATQAATDPARQIAPPDGWASQEGGTVGGSAALPDQIYSVSNRAQLLTALTNGGDNPKIIKVMNIIDMSDGQPYTSGGDQAARGAIRLKSNTTLIGAGSNAGFLNGHISIANISQVIIRNLKISNPCDVAPIWDPLDGATGNWNSAYDGIAITGSRNIWIDHNSFTDLPNHASTLPIENGKPKICHDGALDISNASDLVTVSYNHFSQHSKNNLIGSSDSAVADEGKLRITFSNNVFKDVNSRAPRVRFGKVHLFNNYHEGSKGLPYYSHSYSVGVGQNAKILSSNNAYAVGGAKACTDIVTDIGGTGGGYRDTGSTLNGAALACAFPPGVLWTPPYAFTPRPTALVKANALAQAGGGKLVTTVTGTGNSTPPVTTTLNCPATGLYFCDDFQNGNADKWQLLPLPGANGSFAVKDELVGSSNKVLQYTAASTGGILALVKPDAFGGVPSGNYFVEARIRPMTNGTTGNKHLFLITRYVDANNWYAAGLNVQNATSSTQVEIAKMLNGALTRPKQVRKAIAMDAQFYTVRFEMIGSTLTVYLDGEKLGFITDTSFSARGQIGLYTANKTFMIDDVRVGDPNLKPVQLTLNPGTPTYVAEAGDTPLQVNVTAVRADGGADTFSAVSSNPAAVQVSLNGAVATLTPVGPGNANIVFTSGSDAGLTRSIAAVITPQFIQPTQTYLLNGATMPAAADGDAHIDAPLKLSFDSPPTLGVGGTIRIFRKSDNALIDVLKPAGEIDALGHTGQSQLRRVNYLPVKIVGNTVHIKPHNNKLEYGTEYYVAIADGVFANTTLGGTPFVGIGKAAGWSFTTRAAPPSSTTVSVDDDGPADFRTVQGAINYATKSFSKAEPVTIDVRNGRYEELLFLRNKDNLTIRGESRDGVTIHYKNYDTLNPGSGGSEAPASSGTPAGGRAILLVETADMLTMETLTFVNTTLRAGNISAQAETMYFNSEGRLVVKNAAFHSEQDTLNLKGYAWFYQTLVAGNVDFIWGGSRVALFEDSEIRSVGDTTNATSGGYILQARVPAANDKGFVFLNSKLTHGPGPGPLGGDVPNGATWLARSGGSPTYFDNIAFINCKMDSHVAPAGWFSQPPANPLVPGVAGGWREYGSTDLMGNPLNLGSRLGGYVLSAEEAAAGFASRAQIFSAYGGGTGWNPQP